VGNKGTIHIKSAREALWQACCSEADRTDGLPPFTSREAEAGTTDALLKEYEK